MRLTVSASGSSPMRRKADTDRILMMLAAVKASLAGSGSSLAVDEVDFFLGSIYR
jgi:hypothetical protein